MSEDNNSSDEEEFEDAPSNSLLANVREKGYSQEVAMGLEALIRAVQLVITNQYQGAEAFLRDKAKHSLYHGVGHALIIFMQATLSLDQDSVENAHITIKKALDLCNKHRRQVSVWDSFSGIWYGKRLDGYTVAELHAEVLYAECSLLEALLTFLQDESMMSFIRAGLKIRSCYSMYKQCHSWVKEVMSSPGATVDEHFVSGIQLGVGVFNVVISLLPGKVLKLLEFVGFSGDRSLGLDLLMKGYHSNTCHSPLCSISILSYYCVIASYTGFGSYEDLSLAEEILSTQLLEYPNSGILLYFHGRLSLLNGMIDEGIGSFLHSIEEMSQWRKVHVLCYWELMYSYCYRGNWRTAAYYADQLYQKSKWSKATFLYQKAVYLLMAKRTESLSSGDPQPGDLPTIDATDDEIKDMMRRVPSLKQRIAGKSIPIEKFSINKAERYLQGEQLPLCGLEMIFAWNGFTILEKALPLARKHLAHVWEYLPTLQPKAGQTMDDHCVVSLMQGLCFKSVGRLDEARACFQAVLASSSGLHHDMYTAPTACWQLGLLLMDEGNYTEASKQLETARSSYKGYVLENRIHFRIHAAVSAIHRRQQASNNA